MQQDNSTKRKIVVSGINITHGGPLSIFKDCLKYLSENLSDRYEIVAFVAYKGLIDIPKVTYLDFPKSKTTYFHKLYFEYVVFSRISKAMEPFIWMSISNITPSVKSDILVTYFHNPSLFYKPKLKDLLFEPRVLAFKLFYSILSKVNITKVDFLVIQSSWMASYFEKIIDRSKILIVYPSKQLPPTKIEEIPKEKDFNFFFPAYPRTFKNFEVIAKAAQILNDKGIRNFKVFFTIKGDENLYGKWLYSKFKNVESLVFTGLLTRDKVFAYYKLADCLIFPSVLETWGLPITEFKYFKKPILAAKLQYAYETVGDYDKIKYFNPENALELSSYMEDLIVDRLKYDDASYIDKKDILDDWKELFENLIS